MRSRLQELFDGGRLVQPRDDRPNMVHLVRALAQLAGVPDVPRSAVTEKLTDLIGPSDHLIFVLVDGMGMNLVRRLPGDSFFSRSFKLPINATCPSTTACALTTVATGQYPNRHAVSGWFTYVPELGMTVTMLPFAERFTKQSLTFRGLRAEDLLPIPAVCSRMTHRPLTLLPSQIVNTTYAVYSRGYTAGLGYNSISHAVDEIIDHVSSAREPTYTHLYLPDVDSLCHHIGVEKDEVLELVLKLDVELLRLTAALHARATVVISADHGLIDVPKERQAMITDGDPLMQCLRNPISGDARLPLFHVRDGHHDAFREQFASRFGDGMVLLSMEEAEQFELFGPGRLSEVARPRFGDYVGIAYEPVTLAYSPPTAFTGAPFIGQHAGLSAEEMQIPLIVA